MGPCCVHGRNPLISQSPLDFDEYFLIVFVIPKIRGLVTSVRKFRKTSARDKMFS